MIKVIEGKEHEKYIYSICSLMEIPPEDNIEIYIKKDINEQLVYKKNGQAVILIEDSKRLESSIIYMLQKYRFLKLMDKENKSQALIELMDYYLANYYSLTLIQDFVSKIDEIDIENKNLLDKGIEGVIKLCSLQLNENYLTEVHCNNEKEFVINSAKYIVCRNILRKYKKFDLEILKEENEFFDFFETLNWKNINEKYKELEEIINRSAE